MKKQAMWREAWILGGMWAPLTQAAGETCWVQAVLLGVGAAVLSRWRDTEIGMPRWSGWIQTVWVGVILGHLAHWPMKNWQRYDSYHVIPLVLLLLAAWTARRGEDKPKGVSRAMGKGIFALLAAVMLSGIGSLEWENLACINWGGEGNLALALLLPLGIEIGEKKSLPKAERVILVYTAAACILLTGVIPGPITLFARSITPFGTRGRVQSLAAMAMTLGYYLTFCLLLGITAKQNGCRGVMGAVTLAIILFLSGKQVSGEILAAGSALIWAVLPGIAQFCGKRKKLQKRT